MQGHTGCRHQYVNLNVGVTTPTCQPCQIRLLKSIYQDHWAGLSLTHTHTRRQHTHFVVVVVMLSSFFLFRMPWTSRTQCRARAKKTNTGPNSDRMSSNAQRSTRYFSRHASRRRFGLRLQTSRAQGITNLFVAAQRQKVTHTRPHPRS